MAQNIIPKANAAELSHKSGKNTPTSVEITFLNLSESKPRALGTKSSDNLPRPFRAVRKILSIKLFDDEENRRWKKSIVEKEFEVLCVSQFTLYNTWKGNKPDFHKSMPGEKSKEFYENFLQMLRNAYIPNKVKDGEFGAYMQVSIQNDGPVTFEIESPSTLQEKTRRNGKESNGLRGDLDSDDK